MDREASRPHCGVEAANVSKGDLARPYLKQKPIKKSKPQSTRDGKHELINVAGPMDSRKMTPIREGGGVREDRISPLRSNLKEHPPAKQKLEKATNQARPVFSQIIFIICQILSTPAYIPCPTYLLLSMANSLDSTYDGSHFEAENRGVRRIYAPRSRVMPSFAATCRIVRVGERTELSRASSFGAYRSPRVQSIPQRLSPTGCDISETGPACKGGLKYRPERDPLLSVAPFSLISKLVREVFQVFSLQENDKLSQSLDSHTSQDFDFGSCKSCDGGEKIISSKSSLNPYFETTVQVTAGQNEESTDLKQYRPAGGVAIYTQAPKLLQEIKERSKKLHSCLYGDAQSEHRPPTPRSEQLLPRIEKNLDDVQNLPPLPADLNKDLSHALPCLGRERPKRTARLPARYAKRITQVTTSATTNDTHIPNSDNSTEV
ncbi:unnamed protein product [Mesocestoides corti]|uniref:Uncharacterized protein n=1 Tax=Mesocestoides corti TaxID=53468 RepID=A0A158QUN5_MESCO|nr:unnamed protein product [Mesocestoides corti]